VSLMCLSIGTVSDIAANLTAHFGIRWSCNAGVRGKNTKSSNQTWGLQAWRYGQKYISLEIGWIDAITINRTIHLED
jgi:hypothetical protein